MDWESRIILIVVLAVIGGVFKLVGAIIGSPAERAARELEQERAMRLAHHRRASAAEEVATNCEHRAAALIDEFPTLGDQEIAILMHDELTNMRSPHRAYYDWATPANVARVRRTLAVNAARAARSLAEK